MTTPQHLPLFPALPWEHVVSDTQLREAYTRAAILTDHIDAFCSSTLWAFNVFEAFSPYVESYFPAQALVYPLSTGFLGFEYNRHESPRTLYPIGHLSGWLVSCPLVGHGREALGFEAAARLLADPSWEHICLRGASLDSLTIRAFLTGLQPYCDLFHGTHPSTRILASLEGGFESYLSRRSSRFRKNARRLLRDTKPRFTFEWIDGHTPLSPEEAQVLFERALALELKSWKGAEDTGISCPMMGRFYHQLLLELSQSHAFESPSGGHRLRILFAQRDGEDCAVLFGGVAGSLFRGMLNSFDATYHADSLGNLMQLEAIARLCEEGLSTYELGLVSEETSYKAHWGEQELTDHGVHIRRLSSKPRPD